MVTFSVQCSHRALRAAAAMVGIFFVASCATIPDPTAASPSSPVSPLATEAWPEGESRLDPDALQAVATATVAEYLAATDLITREGGIGPERMAPFTTPQWLITEERAFDHYRLSGIRTIGRTEFDTLIVQSSWSKASGGVALDVVACVDARWVWLLPADAPDPPDGLVDWLMAAGDEAEAGDEEFADWADYLDSHTTSPGSREAIVFWLAGPSLQTVVIDGSSHWEGAHSCHQPPIE